MSGQPARTRSAAYAPDGASGSLLAAPVSGDRLVPPWPPADFLDRFQPSPTPPPTSPAGTPLLVPRQATFARQGAASWGSPLLERSRELGGACSRRAGCTPSYWTYLGLCPVRRECVPGVATGRTLPAGALGPASIKSAAAGRTCSCRARSSAVSPPQSGCLIPPEQSGPRHP
jgi:hypothetical protein